MGINLEGQKCALCNAYLFNEDDVVFCPVCGAPHHRECYNSISHCALEHLHGTDEQYVFTEIEKVEEKPQSEETTQEQNTDFPPFPQGARVIQIDLFGGVKPDYEFDENVSAKDVRNFVLANTQRYIPKFKALETKKTSWNWLAFLFPSGWLFSRKMYKHGIVVIALTLIFTLLALPFSKVLINEGIYDLNNYSEIFMAIQELLPKIDPAIVLTAFAGSVADIILTFVCAIFGDYWYKKHTIATIKKIKSDSEDIPNDFQKKGGISLWMLILAYALVQYIPQIFLALF